MGTVVHHLWERSKKAAGTSADANQGEAVQMPPGAIRDQIVVTAGTCEILSRSVEALQKNLKRLDSIVCMIDDLETRQKLQHQMKTIDASLLRESASLRFQIELLQSLGRLHVL